MPFLQYATWAVAAILFSSALVLAGEPLPIDEIQASLPKGALHRFGSLHFRQPGGIRNSAMSPNGKLLATASGRSVILWDLNTGRMVRQFRAPPEGNYTRPGLTFSPDGTCLSYVHGSESAFIWDIESGKEILRLDGKLKNLSPRARFSPDGSQFVIAAEDGIHFLNVATGNPDRFVQTSRVGAFSPDTKIFVRIDEKAVTVLVDAQTGKEIRTLDVAVANNGIENGVAFSPNTVRQVITTVSAKTFFNGGR